MTKPGTNPLCNELQVNSYGKEPSKLDVRASQRDPRTKTPAQGSEGEDLPGAAHRAGQASGAKPQGGPRDREDQLTSDEEPACDDAAISPVPRALRRRKYLSTRRVQRVYARLSPDEYAEVKVAAKEAGLTPAGFLAELGLAAARTGNGDRLSRLSPDNDSLIEELAALRTALARIGNNLNQIARALHSGADVDFEPGGHVDAVLHRLAGVLGTVDSAALRAATR